MSRLAHATYAASGLEAERRNLDATVRHEAAQRAKRPKTCCVCGADAGRWLQHWNRDAGWGICAQCATEQAKRETPERMTELYGKPGVNYEATDPITAYYTDRANGAHAAKAP